MFSFEALLWSYLFFYAYANTEFTLRALSKYAYKEASVSVSTLNQFSRVFIS